MTVGISAIPALSRTMQGEELLQPEEMAAMLRLHEFGWERSGWRRNSGARATRWVGICARAGRWAAGALLPPRSATPCSSWAVQAPESELSMIVNCHCRLKFVRETFRRLARLRGMECRAPELHAEAFVFRRARLL
jgi:hypothetical protein